MAPSCPEGARMWVSRQAIRTAAVGEDGVQRPQSARTHVALHILPQFLPGFGPCVVTDFLAEAANRQYLFHPCLHSAVQRCYHGTLQSRGVRVLPDRAELCYRLWIDSLVVVCTTRE